MAYMLAIMRLNEIPLQEYWLAGLMICAAAALGFYVLAAPLFSSAGGLGVCAGLLLTLGRPLPALAALAAGIAAARLGKPGITLIPLLFIAFWLLGGVLQLKGGVLGPMALFAAALLACGWLGMRDSARLALGFCAAALPAFVLGGEAVLMREGAPLISFLLGGLAGITLLCAGGVSAGLAVKGWFGPAVESFQALYPRAPLGAIFRKARPGR